MKTFRSCAPIGLGYLKYNLHGDNYLREGILYVIKVSGKTSMSWVWVKMVCLSSSGIKRCKITVNCWICFAVAFSSVEQSFVRYWGQSKDCSRFMILFVISLFWRSVNLEIVEDILCFGRLSVVANACSDKLIFLCIVAFAIIWELHRLLNLATLFWSMKQDF